MHYQDFQPSLNHLLETEEQKVTQALLEMHCQRSGPFGTGGFMFAGADPFSPGLPFQQCMPLISQSTISHDVVPSSNPCAFRFPFELELIIRTLEKVALDGAQEANNVSKLEVKRAKNSSVSQAAEENSRIKQDNLTKIPTRLCNMSFNDSFNLFGTETQGIGSSSSLEPQFCHDWWGWGETKDSTSEATRSREEKLNKTGNNKDEGTTSSKKDPESSRSRSTMEPVSKKSVGGVKRPRDGHSKKTESCTEGEEDSSNGTGTRTGTNTTDDDSNLSSITIVLDNDDSDDDDDGKPGKRPNTHKKGQPQEPSKKQSGRRSYRTPSKSAKPSHSPRNKPRGSIGSHSSLRRTGRQRNVRAGRKQGRRCR